jgi:hypothetical protein
MAVCNCRSGSPERHRLLDIGGRKPLKKNHPVPAPLKLIASNIRRSLVGQIPQIILVSGM